MDFNYTPTVTTTFSVMVIDNDGCTAQDWLTVYVDQRVPVFIPNAFSPNGDNMNDHFTIFTDDFAEVVESLIIFDRWGEMVFKNENFEPNVLEFGWDGNLDGKPMNPAVFVFYARVRMTDGRVIEFEGDLTLTR